MRAIVLVGGEGTRLRPLTYTTPKPLLPIANQAFLERQLTWLAAHGVEEVVLSLGYLPDAFVEHFPEGRFGALTLTYAVEPYPLGTAGAIRFAAEASEIDERFIVCNGDVLTALDLTSLLAFHEERGAEATIHLAQVVDPSAFGVVPRYADGEVMAFVEKPPPGSAPTDWINAGTYVLEPDVLERIPQNLAVSIERETFPRMLEKRGRLYAMESDDYWLDIGTPDKFLDAQADVLGGAVDLPPIAGAREIAPNVWAQGDVEIDDDATVGAPALIGAGSQVRGGALVTGSVLGAGCVIGEGASVETSVLFDGARLATDARAIHSIVGEDARVDSGASVLDVSIVGAEARVTGGRTVVGGRVAVTA